MTKNIIIPLSILTLVFVVMAGCAKDDQPSSASRPPVVSDSWTEEFDDVSTLGTKGWVIVNNSDRVGPEAWRQGRFETANKSAGVSNSVIGFPAFSATKSQHDFISCDFYAGSDVANMSVWLITPSIKMKNGDQLSFYTRSAIDSGSFFFKSSIDRMQVRANLVNTGTNAGKTWTATGDFSALWLDINPSLADGGYPNAWTKFTITLSGVTGTVMGRIAFRYFVDNAGPDGGNGGMIGIDAMSYTAK